MKTIIELKSEAKQIVQPKLFEAIIAVFILGAILIPSFPTGIGLVLGGPLGIGLIYYLKQLKNKEQTNFNVFLDGFKEPLTSSIVAYILRVIFIFLWSLLFIIPGIIKYYSYSMTLFIISEQPKVDGIEAIRQSQVMMNGNKLKLFSLHLSYIGWFLLGIITFGIAIIYIMPFIKAAELAFYEDVKTQIKM